MLIYRHLLVLYGMVWYVKRQHLLEVQAFLNMEFIRVRQIPREING